MRREDDGFDAAAGEERSFAKYFNPVSEYLLLEIDTAVESTGAETLQLAGKECILEHRTAVESEITDRTDRRRNSDIRQVLTLIETGRWNSRDGSRDRDRFEALAVRKSTLGDETDGDFILEDIFRRQVIIGSNQAIVDDESAFLPFLLVVIESAACEGILTDRGDGSGNDDFLEVLAIAECLMVDA